LFDVNRGTNYRLYSDLTNAEYTVTTLVTAFNSNGFNLGSDGSGNQSGQTYVGWQWKAGGTPVTNNTGSLSCQLSANPTAGFSVATFTPPASGSSFTIGHGLGVAPELAFVKIRNNAAVNWFVYSKTLGNTGYIILNGVNGNLGPMTGAWNNTDPTSSVMTFGNYWIGNSYNMVAYMWASVAGYSSIGSYTGNGSSTGPFVYTGFQSRFILIKANGSADWVLHDTGRNPYNIVNYSLYANTGGAEDTLSPINILSNGFQIASTAGNVNNNGTTYIYMAFAANPFKYSTAF
jgi:hypothetical protein